jgi:hypothetical protein
MKSHISAMPLFFTLLMHFDMGKRVIISGCAPADPCSTVDEITDNSNFLKWHGNFSHTGDMAALAIAIMGTLGNNPLVFSYRCCSATDQQQSCRF